MKTFLECVLGILALVLLSAPSATFAQSNAEGQLRRYLYVAQPGIRSYLEYGGHGILVFDIDNDYEFVKRIPTSGYQDDGTTPINVKGFCGNAETGRLYVSTIKQLI